MRRLTLSAVLLACLAPAAVNAADAGPWTLQYRLRPKQVLRYKLVANVHGVLPLFNNPEPIDANAVIRLVYKATAGAQGADGRWPVQFRVESVEVEVEKIPLPLAIEDVQRILDQDVTIARTGDVVAVKTGGALPYDINIPGVDPTRLYTLLFPLVFPDGGLSVGDTWQFPVGLLGGNGTVVQATATVLAPRLAVARPGARPPAGATAVPVREVFGLVVDQKLNRERKPQGPDEVHGWNRTGKIDGDGTFHFDRAKGVVTSGSLKVTADLEEKPVGEPVEGQPAMIPTRVRAQIEVTLVPPATPKKPAAKPAAGKAGRKARG